MADEIIGGYRLVRNLATGQTSQVWEVVEDSSARHFAMKLLLPEKLDNVEHRQFLLHEAAVGLKMAHDNIIRIFKVDPNVRNPFFIMEFFPAGALRNRIVEAKRSEKDRDFLREKGQDILKQMATGLAFMNAQGWVHRDIKPENVLINGAGNTKLIDFAIAQQIPTGWAKTFWRKKKPQGTRSYMSPEQIRGEPLDGRADMYSFAITAYELTTLRTPFRGSSSTDLLNKHLYEKPMSPQIHNPDITKEFSDLVVHMLAKKRDDRPKDFHDVLIRMRAMRIFKEAGKKPADV
jgi:eukaryotic-like serine/threonine-protein kinase